MRPTTDPKPLPAPAGPSTAPHAGTTVSSADAMDALHAALVRASPRFGPPLRTPWRSVAIHGGLLALWVALFAMAFSGQGVMAWSVGVAYVAYDTLLLLFVGWHTWGLWRAGAAAETSGFAPRPTSTPTSTATATATASDLSALSGFGSQPSLCVLVASHNEVRALPLTLAALKAQTVPPEQVLIVDDGSSDATARWLAKAHGMSTPPVGRIGAPSTTWPAVRWLRLDHGGKARALNAALTLVSQDIVLTVDGDTLLDPHALAAVRKAFAAEPALVAATGIIVPVCGPGWRAQMFQWFQTYEYIRNFLSRYAWMRLDSLLLVSGAFAGYRRAALLQVGGFDPDSMVEDYELTHRLRRYAQHHGLVWTVRVLGGARARTDAPASLRAFLRQRRRWFGGFLQTQFRYREMVGDQRYGWLGTLMLPVKAVDTLQPLYGLTAFGLLVFDVATGRIGALQAAAGVIGIKLAIDLAFHLWSIRLYQRWVGGTARAHLGEGLLAALAEPFTFQLLRHTGAAMGWMAFVTRRWHWGVQRRAGVVADSTAVYPDSTQSRH